MRTATRNNTTAFPAPELDTSITYLVTLVSLEQRDNVDAAPRYTPEGKEINPARVYWKFQLTDIDSGRTITVPDSDQPFYVIGSSSDSTYLDTTGAFTARARQWMHALSGRTLSNDESDAMLSVSEDDPNENHALPYCLIGSAAYAELSTFDRADGSTGYGIANLTRVVKPGANGRKGRTTTVKSDTEQLEDLPF